MQHMPSVRNQPSAAMAYPRGSQWIGVEKWPHWQATVERRMDADHSEIAALSARIESLSADLAEAVKEIAMLRQTLAAVLPSTMPKPDASLQAASAPPKPPAHVDVLALWHQLVQQQQPCTTWADVQPAAQPNHNLAPLTSQRALGTSWPRSSLLLADLVACI